jgi:hypothetical protein
MEKIKTDFNFRIVFTVLFMTKKIIIGLMPEKIHREEMHQNQMRLL